MATKQNKVDIPENKGDPKKTSVKKKTVTKKAASKKKTKGKAEAQPRKVSSNQEKLKERNKMRRKKERFLVSRMWLSTLISKFFLDRGTIPDNIGNNMLVTNNVFTTKNYISAMFLVTEMEESTPVSWTSDLVKFVKDQTDGCVVDFAFKGATYYPDLDPSSIRSRERTWQQTLENPNMPEHMVRRAARCLYSLDIARSGVQLYRMRCYIKARAIDGTSLKKAIQAISIYLSAINAQYKKLESNLDEHLAYVSLMSDLRPQHLKDVTPCIFSLQTFAESMPCIQGANDETGVMLGYDNISGYPYLIDFQASSNAKNIMIEALSGWGKTFLATCTLYPFYASGFNLSIMDIKGTEFNAITQALHGITLSMRTTSTYYINTYKWNQSEVFDGDYVTYANERLRLSKEKMLIICDLNEKEESQGEALLEEFLQYLYKSAGVINSNTNTWYRTDRLNPYVVFEKFKRYLSNEILHKYSEVATKMLERMRIYMSSTGSKSHIFRDPYNYIDVLDTRCLTFDFGILEGAVNNDRIMFRLHVSDMLLINDVYTAHKKRQGLWTVKLMEESQIADDWLLKCYTREMTLRRASNQISILLGNSISALHDNPVSRPLVDNINILILGSINKSSRRFLQEEFGLKESEEDILEDIQTNPSMARKFLLINRMQADSTTAVLSAEVPEVVSQSPLFKVVDTIESED